MKLNHINLVVTDVAAAVKFFEVYFAFTCTEIKGDNIVAVLKGAENFTLVIMTSKDIEAYPKAFHIGFMQESKEDVIDVYNQLKTGGIGVGVEPRRIRDSFGFYFVFDHIMIEVGCYAE